MTRKPKCNGIVKDEFRDVAFQNGDSLTLCTDCLKVLSGGVLLAVILDNEYDEIYCDQCSAMNSVAAYISEIDLPPSKSSY